MKNWREKKNKSEDPEDEFGNWGERGRLSKSENVGDEFRKSEREKADNKLAK